MNQPVSGGPGAPHNKWRTDAQLCRGWQELEDEELRAHMFLNDRGRSEICHSILRHLGQWEIGEVPVTPYIFAFHLYPREQPLKYANRIRKKLKKIDRALVWWASELYPQTNWSQTNRSPGREDHLMLVAVRDFTIEDLVGDIKPLILVDKRW